MLQYLRLKLSLFVDQYIKPHVSSPPSYVQDDMDFLRKFEFCTLPPNLLLCTVDVSALYTNIPTQEGISASRSLLQDKFAHEQLDDFCDLMNIVLIHKNFTFVGKHFRQLFGTSMGTKMAPSMACLFMGCLEEAMLSGVNKKTLVWIRYIDDVFFFFFFFFFLPHGPDDLDHFMNFCNNFYPTIKFTSESSPKEIPFLDVMVSIKHWIDSTLICTLNPLMPTSSFT